MTPKQPPWFISVSHRGWQTGTFESTCLGNHYVLKMYEMYKNFHLLSSVVFCSLVFLFLGFTIFLCIYLITIFLPSFSGPADRFTKSNSTQGKQLMSFSTKTGLIHTVGGWPVWQESQNYKVEDIKRVRQECSSHVQHLEKMVGMITTKDNEAQHVKVTECTQEKSNWRFGGKGG